MILSFFPFSSFPQTKLGKEKERKGRLAASVSSSRYRYRARVPKERERKRKAEKRWMRSKLRARQCPMVLCSVPVTIGHCI